MIPNEKLSDQIYLHLSHSHARCFLTLRSSQAVSSRLRFTRCEVSGKRSEMVVARHLRRYRSPNRSLCNNNIGSVKPRRSRFTAAVSKKRYRRYEIPLEEGTDTPTETDLTYHQLHVLRRRAELCGMENKCESHRKQHEYFVQSGLLRTLNEHTMTPRLRDASTASSAHHLRPSFTPESQRRIKLMPTASSPDPQCTP